MRCGSRWSGCRVRSRSTSLAISTPTVPKYGIHKLYLTSTQEHFYFQCPCCSRWTELTWPDCVEIIGESVNDPRCKESFLKCKECKHKLEHADKPLFLAGGQWKATESNVSPEESRGFYINQLYSSTVTPGELVTAYHRGLGDEAANTEFIAANWACRSSAWVPR